MNLEWKIKPRAEQCCKTGHPFANGEVFYTLLNFEGGNLVRLDFCTQAWEEIKAEQNPASFWKCIFKPALTKSKEEVPKKDAESQLRHLLEEPQPLNATQAKLCHLLALLLERKKVLRLKEKRSEGEDRILVYEHNETHEAFIVPDVELKLEEAEALQADFLIVK